MNIWQDMYCSLEWAITKHIIRWVIEKEETFYIATVNSRDTIFNNKQYFETLEEAKEKSIEYLKWKIEELNKLIEEVKNTETIEYTSELMPWQ